MKAAPRTMLDPQWLRGVGTQALGHVDQRTQSLFIELNVVASTLYAGDFIYDRRRYQRLYEFDFRKPTCTPLPRAAKTSARQRGKAGQQGISMNLTKIHFRRSANESPRLKSDGPEPSASYTGAFRSASQLHPQRAAFLSSAQLVFFHPHHKYFLLPSPVLFPYLSTLDLPLKHHVPYFSSTSLALSHLSL